MNDTWSTHDVDVQSDDPYELYLELIRQLCEVMEIPDHVSVQQTRRVQVNGYQVLLDYLEADPEAIYLLFDYGVPTAGRTMPVFRLMLESNLLVYAQDQAQLGMDPDTGSVLLIVRVGMSQEIDGEWLLGTLEHYAEHGNYWSENLLRSSDEMFEGLSAGQFLWLKA